MSAANIKKFGKIGVLRGGLSAEREVSLKSGAAVLEALESVGANVVDIELNEGNRDAVLGEQLPGMDTVFIALHGRGGEDGVMQGYLELIGKPYTGSGVQASAIAMDKIKTKQIWQACGLRTPGFAVIRQGDDLGNSVAGLGFPCMVKPAREGSSIGMFKVDSVAQLEEAASEAFRYDTELLVEEWIEGNEYTVAILGESALPAIRLETANVFYDYNAKYLSDDTRYHCPCGLDSEKEDELLALCLKAFQAIGCRGWGRVDAMQNSSGEFCLLEVNTVPGMTDHSLVPMAARQAGMGFADLVCRILEEVA